MLFLTTLLACAPEVLPTDTEVPAPSELGLAFVPYSDDGAVVASVDPARYVGVWYEIATTGSFQQQQCTGTTATYTALNDTTVEVLNRCYVGTLDGPLNEIVGTATAVDDTFSRLLVDFNLGFEAPYDIVELDGTASDAPYAFAAVSSLGGAQIWILSRTPQLDAEVYDALVERLDARGLDPDRLVLTDQPTE